MKKGKKPPRSGRGFTLVELLVVIVIVSILTSASLVALQGTLGAFNLTGSSNAVIAELNLGRQIATTKNLSVDFRIYSIPDSAGTPAYRAIGLVVPASASGAAADEYVTKPVALQGDVVIVSNTSYSSLLNPAASSTLPPATGTENAAAPYLVRNKPYVKFTFLPNGSLNLDSTVAWCLTLANEHSKAPVTGKTPAANYVAIVMDCESGRASVFQP